MSIRYRVYCKTDQRFEYVWTDTLPTECPVDPAHDINVDSIESYEEEHEVYPISCARYKTKNKSYTRILTFHYDEHTMGIIRRFEYMSYMDKKNEDDDNNPPSYWIEVYDQTTSTSLMETEFTNTSVDAVKTQALDTPLIHDHLISINLRRDNSTSSRNVYLESVTPFRILLV